MKRTIVGAILLAFATASFGQQSAPKLHWTETDYYKKSKKQKTWAWITTSVGVAVIVPALIADSNPAFGEVPVLDEGEQLVYTTGYVIGGACIATGIVLFVASDKNKKKARAASVFIRMEKAPVIQAAAVSTRSFPAFALRLSL